MIFLYKTPLDNPKIHKLENLEVGCWIHLVDPSEQESILISKKTGVPLEFINAALDEEETSRIDIEDDNILFIVDMPYSEMEENSLTYETFPLGIIYTNSYIITVSLKNSKVFSDFIDGKIKSFYTYKRSRFVLQLLYRVAGYYLNCLSQIGKKSLMLQKTLHKSMSNKVLSQLLSLQNSLVYFSTSLKANEATLEKMLKLSIMQKYEEDKDILEDVIIENKQALEMTSIYTNILNTTMDASANMISNNLNQVMKFLASITIVMSIPDIFSGIFGMNMGGLPLLNNPNGFSIVISVIFVTTIITIIFLNRKKMF